MVVVSAHNKWYQSIPGSSWDHLVIRRASVAGWRRSCVDLRSVLALFVGSCVDLRTTHEVLKESIEEYIYSETHLGFCEEVKI